MSKVIKLCCLLIAFLASGCGKLPTGNAINGTVTFRGQPLDQGTIEFSPAAGQGTMSGGPIKNGQYLLPAEQGLEPGAYTVRIYSRDAGEQLQADEAPGEATGAPTQRIPAEYNTETTLKAEVKAGENKFDFNIP